MQQASCVKVCKTLEIPPYFCNIPSSKTRDIISVYKENLSPLWENLPVDTYVIGKYRYRRYGRFSFSPNDGTIQSLSRKEFTQKSQYNNLFPDIKRYFEPLELVTEEQINYIKQFIKFDIACLPDKYLDSIIHHELEVGVHLIRIIASEKEDITPTPEGIHKDGFDYVSIHLIQSNNIHIESGVSRIYDENKKLAHCFQLRHFLDSIIINDRKVFHDVSAIVPNNETYPAIRDVLITTFSNLT